ncbi:MAG: hypothetical protein ACR2LQ_10355 [Acidimicrobiales bacterium]
MPRRIDVELTSARDDGSWTWRAVGARQPKGTVDAKLVPDAAKVGDVLRADADFDVEGVTLVALTPVQAKRRTETARIEVVGDPRGDEPLVTSTLVPKGRTDRGDRGGPRGERPRRDDDARGAQRPGGDARAARAEGQRRDRRPGSPAETEGRAERRGPPARPETPAKPKPKRLRAQRAHRNAALDELPVEHRPIAEQVLQGDIPAVRQAIDKENEARAAKGEAPIDGTQLIAIAEGLRPSLRTAEWRDKAEAALSDIEELDLRDLRSVVVASDAAARDEETRTLASRLRDALARRVESEQAAWLSELSEALDGGRVVRALRLSSRPPKAGTILRPELAAKLSEAASAALTELAAQDRWAVLLDAVAHSPVRLTVRPHSVPAAPSTELTAAVKKLASQIPEIAALLGVEARPAPKRVPRRPPKPPRAAPKPVAEPAKPAPDAPAVSSEEHA